MKEPTTYFGYERVLTAEKTTKVKSVFDSVASNYDLMNDLMSFGMHRLWKKIAISCCNIQSGQKVLDLAGGTGDLTIELIKLLGSSGHVVLADINYDMLHIGRKKIINKGILSQVSYLQADAENLPILSNTFDCVCIGFGLRNVTDTEQALREIYRTLKPGGRLVILEFSHPTSPILKSIYDAYSFSFLPLLGKIVTNDWKSYQYLVESIRMHHTQIDLKNIMEDIGFERCKYINMHAGICAIHQGFKF